MLQTEGISMRTEGSGWERDWLHTGLPIKINVYMTRANLHYQRELQMLTKRHSNEAHAASCNGGHQQIQFLV